MKSSYLIILYFILLLLSSFLPFSFAINTLIVEIILFIISIICIIKNKNQKKFNFLGYIKNIILYEIVMLLILLVFYYLYPILFNISLFNSSNEQSLESMPFILLCISSLILSPLIEETIFRMGFMEMTKNKWYFLVISSVVFGLLHSLGETSFINFLLYLVPYSLLGLVLAISYKKTNNVFIPIICHIIFNVINLIIIY